MTPGGRKPPPSFVRILNLIAEARTPSEDAPERLERLYRYFRGAGFPEPDARRLAASCVADLPSPEVPTHDEGITGRERPDRAEGAPPAIDPPL